MDSPNDAQATTYCFGDCRFIPARQLLLHRDVPIRLGSRAVDLLHALVRRPGIVVSKDDLIRSAWPDVSVDDSNLKVNIAALRRALAQDRSGPTFIATVPGRGYRFVAPISVAGPADEAAIRGITGQLPAIPALVGRDAALAEIVGGLPGTRLLTIVGPPGVGKTSIAAAVAQQVGHRLRHGICFVDLAAVEDPQLVAPAVAFALGLNSNSFNVLAALVETLRKRTLLLVLDNCEHVLSAAATVADGLNLGVPGLLIIATSREPLRCRGESVYRLEPLPIPPAGGALDATAIRFAAVELLVQRAETHGYRFDAADAGSLASISRRLDGIALSIELVAPRLAADGPAELADLLEESFALLAFQGDTPTNRHTTLMTTLDWSYNLLSQNEARLLRHLSVFGATFALEDVVGAFASLGSALDLTNWLESLAAKSLLSPSYHSGRRRYRLLDTTRGFAAYRLQADGEQNSAMDAYARHLLGLFTRAEAEWSWRAREEWVETYGHWSADLLRAIDWSWRDGQARELGIRLTAAAIPLWNEMSSLTDMTTRVSEALEALDGMAIDDLILRLKLVCAHALNLNFSDHRGAEIQATWRDAIALAEKAGSLEYRLRTVMGWAGALTFSGDHRLVLVGLSELRALLDKEGGHSAAPDVERLELANRFYCGEIAAAVAGMRAMARAHSAIAYRSQISRFQLDRFVGIRSYLAPMLWVVGEHEEALDVAQEGISAAVRIGHPVSLMHVLAVGGISVSLWSGLPDLARSQLKQLEAQHQLCPMDTWSPFIRFYRAAVDAAAGDPQAVDRMDDAIRGLIARNLRIQLAMNLAMLSDAALLHNRLDVVQRVAVEALDYLNHDEAWCRSELLRVVGLARWREGDTLSAVEYLARAVQVARKSGARSLELRAATQLAKLSPKTRD